MHRVVVPAVALAAVGVFSTSLLAASHTPNNVKYSDHSVSQSTGRSGDATLAARALINRDGTADLDLTTGSFDGAAPTGTIDKAQVKIPNEPGARNFNSLGNSATVSLHLDHAIRKAPVDVQANVSQSDAHRTDVVSAAPLAGLRPDLAAGALSAPAQAAPGAPVMIFGTVREANGDNGARATCVLSVNGSPVDRAAGIWVDAGDSVTCRFGHTFNEPGTYQLQLSVENVSPADWSTDNNMAAASIEIVSRMSSWIFQSREETYTRRAVQNAPWQSYETTESGHVTATTFTGYIDARQVGFDQLQISYRETSGGTTFADLDIPQIGPATGSMPKCKEFSDDKVTLWACNPGWPKNFPYDDDFDPNVISLSGGRTSTKITYHSSGTSLSGGYPYDFGYTQVQGVQASYGDSVNARIVASDRTGRQTAESIVPLTPYSRFTDQPYECRGPVCSSTYDKTDGKAGRASYKW